MKKFILISLLLAACGPINVGSQGPPGQNGASCTTINVAPGSPGAPDGGALITCTTGSQSLILNGASLTPVQFCPNVMPSYPTIFPEVGFCIAGSIYAVYSANDGFLTELPPGAYNSNAIGSDCNFTILSGCVIQ